MTLIKEEEPLFQLLAKLIVEYKDNTNFEKELKKYNLKLIPNKFSNLKEKLKIAGFDVIKIENPNLKINDNLKNNIDIDYNKISKILINDYNILHQFYIVAHKELINSQTLVLSFKENNSYHMNQFVKLSGKIILEDIIKTYLNLNIIVKIQKK